MTVFKSQMVVSVQKEISQIAFTVPSFVPFIPPPSQFDPLLLPACMLPSLLINKVTPPITPGPFPCKHSEKIQCNPGRLCLQVLCLK